MQTLATRIDGPVAVIGDVHGHADKLAAILEQLRETAGWDRRWLVFIGDLIDRGPDSKTVVDMVSDLLIEHPRTTVVAGNHEFAMSAALGLIPTPEYTDWSEQWVKYYDAEPTFESYSANFANLIELAERMPAKHKTLLASLSWCVEHPEYLFVHAGLDSNSPFEMQLRILRHKDFSLSRPLWLCDKISVDAPVPPDCPFTVVSGHVHVRRVEFRRKRIAIDTIGPQHDLSCVLLPEKQVITSGTETVETQPRSWWKIW